MNESGIDMEKLYDALGQTFPKAKMMQEIMDDHMK